MAGLNERQIEARILRRKSSSLLGARWSEFMRQVVGDILEPPEKLAQYMSGCDWVFHVAAVSDYWRQDRDWLYKVNVEGTKNVLAAADLRPV